MSEGVPMPVNADASDALEKNVENDPGIVMPDKMPEPGQDIVMLDEMPERNPTDGTFELTIRCNLHCKMCLFRHDDSENAELMAKELTAKQWIDMAPAGGRSRNAESSDHWRRADASAGFL